MKTPEQIVDGQLNEPLRDQRAGFGEGIVHALLVQIAELKEDKLTLEEDNHAMRERLKELERAVQDAAQKAQDLADGIRRI